MLGFAIRLKARHVRFVRIEAFVGEMIQIAVVAFRIQQLLIAILPMYIGELYANLTKRLQRNRLIIGQDNRFPFTVKRSGQNQLAVFYQNIFTLQERDYIGVVANVENTIDDKGILAVTNIFTAGALPQ